MSDSIIFHPTVERPSLCNLEWILVSTPNSIANLGQLSLDLIISNNNMERIGWLESDFFVPFAANDAFASDPGSASGTLHYACEVYLDTSAKRVMCVHLRSPVFPQFALQFASAFKDWISSFHAKVMLLSGADAIQLEDAAFAEQVSKNESRLRFLHSDKLDYSDLSLDNQFKQLLLEAKGLGDLDKDQLVGDAKHSTVAEKYRAFPLNRWILPGTGLGRLLCELLQEAKVPSIMALLYVTEGDNTEDAVTLATSVLSKLGRSLGREAESGKNLGSISVESALASKLRLPLSWSNFYGPNKYAQEIQ